MLRPDDCKAGVLVECVASDVFEVLTLRAIYTIEAYISHCCMGPAIVVEGVESMTRSCGCFGLSHFRLLPGDALDVFREALVPVVKLRETEEV